MEEKDKDRKEKSHELSNVMELDVTSFAQTTP